MNYARTWKQEQRRQREEAVIRAMYWILTALFWGTAAAVGLMRLMELIGR